MTTMTTMMTTMIMMTMMVINAGHLQQRSQAAAVVSNARRAGHSVPVSSNYSHLIMELLIIEQSLQLLQYTSSGGKLPTTIYAIVSSILTIETQYRLTPQVATYLPSGVDFKADFDAKPISGESYLDGYTDADFENHSKICCSVFFIQMDSFQDRNWDKRKSQFHSYVLKQCKFNQRLDTTNPNNLPWTSLRSMQTNFGGENAQYYVVCH